MSEVEELLDVLDDDGRPIGQKSRAQVHRDHDRHGLVFVWVAWESNGRQFMLLQRRGRDGDSFIGRADALAGGHIGAGETPLVAACRELVEEVGLEVDPGGLVHLGSSRKDRPTGDCRRIFQHLFLLNRAVDMKGLSLSTEVDGFYLVDLHDFEALILGERRSIAASIRSQRGTANAELYGETVDYPDAILDTFRRSLASIIEWLSHGQVNPTHFES